MNEVTTIHLARQVFTVSADAYHELKSYIEAISKQIKDKDVVDEIELRMSELLLERGVDANKVVLAADVDYLKSQLGSPSDFTDEENEPAETTEAKKLFRDTDNALVAGVAAGLAKYFGLDLLLVRIIFVILVLLTAGWGILIYILLWLLVPEAKTSSERLLMAGKPVNVKSLKQVVEQADVKGAAKRVNNAFAKPINQAFNIILKISGIALVAFGLSALFGLIAAATYFIAHHSDWVKNNIFPVGNTENALLYVTSGIAVLMIVFIILFGIAIYRRKWPIKVWATGVLVGLVLIGTAVSGALGADVYPTVRDAYNANNHTLVRNLQPFTGLAVEGSSPDDIKVLPSDKYMVVLNYYGHPDLSTVKTTVKNNSLVIDTSNFNWQRNCSSLCFPRSYRLNITVYAPNALQYAPQVPAMPSPMVPTNL